MQLDRVLNFIYTLHFNLCNVILMLSLVNDDVFLIKELLSFKDTVSRDF
jgi:hypothetical protein